MSLKIPNVVTVGSGRADGDSMCQKYKLEAKRPWQDEFTPWCDTDNYEAIERNIKTIESYGYEWKLTEGGAEQ